MNIKFKDKLLADLYEGKPTSDKRFKSNKKLVEKYIKTVNKLEYASRIEDLYQLHSLNYEKVVGKLAGLSSVRIDDKYRLLFEEATMLSDESDSPIVVLLLEEISNHYS